MNRTTSEHVEITYGIWRGAYLTILVPLIILFCTSFVLGFPPTALLFFVAVGSFFILLAINYEIVLTKDELRIPIIPKVWYLKVKIEDIVAICKAKDYAKVFKQFYPEKKLLNKPLFGAVVITKTGLFARGIGIYPENAEKLIADFERIKKAQHKP